MTITIVIRGERAPSWNGMWAGMHWRKRMKVATDIHLKVRKACEELGDVEMLDSRVDIMTIGTYRKQPPDSDNVVDKPYIDGLKGILLRDDNGLWVRRATTEARVGEEDSVTIVITPVE